jgi:hypothetical protein
MAKHRDSTNVYSVLVWTHQLSPAAQIVILRLVAGRSQTHTYTGPLLRDLLAHAGPEFDPTIKNDKLRYCASASATGDYQALVAYGEIDPGFENKIRETP